jgi:hypothetical protein
MLDRQLARTFGFGAIGGLAGTVLMDLVMVTTFVMVGEPGDAFFVAVGERLGDGSLAGIAVHNIIGLSGGLVFAFVILAISPLRIDSRNKGLAYGLAAGAMTIPLGCVPMAIWLGEPVLGVVAFSILPHLVWGLTLGWAVACGLLRSQGSRSLV